MKFKMIIGKNGKVYVTNGHTEWEVKYIADVEIGVDTIKCDIGYYEFAPSCYVMENTPENVAALRQFSSLKD